jgi:hypothetical protein
MSVKEGNLTNTRPEPDNSNQPPQKKQKVIEAENG